ncbi:MAG TPA: hypothetical protein VFW07_02885 [Parafilimonas sp.]|nr:hypothetical protein [Parafilimonas sp.]
MYELPKKEKKIARAAIDKGVNTAFKLALEEAGSIIKEWQEGKLDNRAAYHKLFKAVDKHDYKIARRYDHVTGSKYLMIVSAILADGHITQDDISEFSDETKAVIRSWAKVIGG